MKSEQSEQTAGNIQTAVFTNKDNGFQSVKWFFTYHIKQNESFEQAFNNLELLKPICNKFIWGEEYGKSGKTPHLQGAFILKSKMRAKTLEQFFTNGVSLFKLKNWDGAFQYCSKEGNNIHSSHKIKKPVRTISEDELYVWQKEIVDICKVEPDWDCRNIYWYYGPPGCGKTQLCKLLKMKYDATILSGDMRHMTAQAQNSDSDIFIILLAYGDEKVSYRAIEMIKDGLYCTSFGVDNNHDECRNAPHLFIIGNEEPDKDDRHFHPGKYIVKKIEN